MPKSENITCGDDFFFDFTNAEASAFYTSKALRLQDSAFHGYFFDDTEGLGTEHPAVIKATGMTQTEVDAWNAARLPVYDTMHRGLLEHGKFEWHMFRDADDNPPRTPGAVSRPTNTSCAAWMKKACSRPFGYEKSPLMLMLSNQFFCPGGGCKQQRPGTIKPEPYIFPWLKQQLAAFLLTLSVCLSACLSLFLFLYLCVCLPVCSSPPSPQTSSSPP